MLTPYLPYPPSSGGQIRSLNLIKQLSKKHQITLYSLIKYEEERKYVSELEKYCLRVKVFKRPEKPWTLKNILKTGTSLYPFLVIRNFSEDEKKDLEQTLKTESFDIIHAETFYVTTHIPKTDIPLVLVDQTIEYQVYQHFVQTFKWRFLKPLLAIDVFKIKYWEEYYWKRAQKVVALSEHDANVMKALLGSKKVSIVPNGVGEDLMEDIPMHFSKNIFFMGNYSWLQNVEAVNILYKEIFPQVLEKVPDAQLLIAGQNTEKLNITENKNVIIVDLKIDDIEGVKKSFKDAGIMIAPLYGPSGARLKIVGAMAAKVPVVTTTIGNQGVDGVHNDSVMLADSTSGMADLAAQLLLDKNLYNKIANNARRLVEEKYTYASVAKILDSVYEEAAVA